MPTKKNAGQGRNTASAPTPAKNSPELRAARANVKERLRAVRNCRKASERALGVLRIREKDLSDTLTAGPRAILKEAGTAPLPMPAVQPSAPKVSYPKAPTWGADLTEDQLVQKYAADIREEDYGQFGYALGAARKIFQLCPELIVAHKVPRRFMSKLLNLGYGEYSEEDRLFTWIDGVTVLDPDYERKIMIEATKSALDHMERQPRAKAVEAKPQGA